MDNWHTFGYLVGTTSAVLFMSCTVPDTLAAFKAKSLSGATWKSPALTATALTLSTLSHVVFENWPLAISDLLGVGMCTTLAYRRWVLGRTLPDTRA